MQLTGEQRSFAGGHRTLLACLLAAAALFFFANRAAYKGWFSSDDLDKLGWTTLVGNQTFLNGILTPRISESNFRAFGYLYYRFLGRTFGLRFTPYVAVLQAFHVVNLVLLFFLLRRLDFPELAAGAATLFYAFHAALIDAYWQPQYIFEVLASILCLTTLLLYLRGHWIVGLIPFWLAYKSKEIVVTLPAAMLAFEWFLGKRQWRRLIPYFLISLNFGLQALWQNESVPDASGYALRFTPHLLWTTIAYYAAAVFFVPFAGFALLLLPVFVRDRRVYVGIIFMVCLFIPMFVLPGRLERVYWYIPMIGLSIAVAAIASRTPAWAIALFFVLWLPVNYVVLREKRHALLATGDAHRWYTTALIEYAHHVPKLKAVVYQSIPPYVGYWGIEGAIHHAFGFDVDTAWYGNGPEARKALSEVPMAIVGYYPNERIVKGLLRTRDELSSYIRFTDEIPIYQFGDGWTHNWGVNTHIASQADVTLLRPQESTQFEVVARGPAKYTVFENDESLGTRILTGSGVQSLHWDLPKSNPGNKTVTICTEPSGPAIQAIGYIQL
jgi:hypothetical protein